MDQARPADLPSHTGFGQQEAAWAQRPSVLQPEAGCPDPCLCLPAKTVQDSGWGAAIPSFQETTQPGADLPERGLVPCAWSPGLLAGFLASLLAGLQTGLPAITGLAPFGLTLTLNPSLHFGAAGLSLSCLFSLPSYQWD